jgi:large subunit ribosomal protein L35
MPKLKSKRAAMKRYRFTDSGKVKIQKPGRRHHLHQKTEKRKRGLNHPGYLAPYDAEKARRLMPYGSR